MTTPHIVGRVATNGAPIYQTLNLSTQPNWNLMLLLLLMRIIFSNRTQQTYLVLGLNDSNLVENYANANLIRQCLHDTLHIDVDI